MGYNLYIILDRAAYASKRKKKRNLVTKIRHRFTSSVSPSNNTRFLSPDALNKPDTPGARGRSRKEKEHDSSSLKDKIVSGIRSISADRFKGRNELRHSYTSGSLRKCLSRYESREDVFYCRQECKREE